MSVSSLIIILFSTAIQFRISKFTKSKYFAERGNFLPSRIDYYTMKAMYRLQHIQFWQGNLKIQIVLLRCNFYDIGVEGGVDAARVANIVSLYIPVYEGKK